VRAGLAAAALAAAAAAAGPQGPGFSLADVAAEAGLRRPTVCGAPDKPSILDGTGPGVGIVDYDGDGWPDLLLRNGGVSYDPGPAHAGDVLYRNLGGWRFEDVTDRAGVRDRRFGHGVTGADVDGDGDTDLILTNYGRDSFYRNLNDGRFEDATEAAGLADDGWTTGAALADADADGDLDLYVAGYVVFDPATTPRLGNPRCLFLGVPVFCGPRGLVPAHDRFYRNRGDGTFLEDSAAAGLRRDEPYYGLGALFADIDDDGDPDLYVADDATPNLLYVNRGDGTFTEEGLPRGAAFSQDGTEQAGMGVASGDYDGDGRIDLVVTNFSHDTHTLYRNGGALFDVATFEAGLGEATLPWLGWGVGFVDFDGDGWRDLFFAHGHVYPQMDGRGLGTSWRQPNLVFRNRGDGTFADVSARAGPGMAVVESSRGAAFGDLDGDGDPDVLVANLDAPPTLLRNDRAAGVAWLGLALHGPAPNRDAIGARVRVTCAGRAQVDEVQAGGSYLSLSEPRLLFGLGPAGTPSGVEVRWPGGARERYRGLPADRYYHVYRRAGEGAR
jgi:hypothetical protein